MRAVQDSQAAVPVYLCAHERSYISSDRVTLCASVSHAAEVWLQFWQAVRSPPLYGDKVDGQTNATPAAASDQAKQRGHAKPDPASDQK